MQPNLFWNQMMPFQACGGESPQEIIGADHRRSVSKTLTPILYLFFFPVFLFYRSKSDRAKASAKWIAAAIAADSIIISECQVGCQDAASGSSHTPMGSHIANAHNPEAPMSRTRPTAATVRTAYNAMSASCVTDDKPTRRRIMPERKTAPSKESRYASGVIRNL